MHFYAGRCLKICQILRELCKRKGIGILETKVCPDYIHILLMIPLKYSVSNIMGYLKGKSSLMIYDKWGDIRYKYRNQEFWCRRYYVATAGKNTQKIVQYIREQLKSDVKESQLTLNLDPFTGNK